MFTLSKKSKLILSGIHPDLNRVVNRAITITPVDFAAGEGKRTKDRQLKLYNAGASHTLNSRHLTGHAIDLRALVDGEERWDWPLYYKIAEAMKNAAELELVNIEWGGVWDKRMTAYDDVEKEVFNYTRRCKMRGRKAFIDGPHFQLSWKDYPNK